MTSYSDIPDTGKVYHENFKLGKIWQTMTDSSEFDLTHISTNIMATFAAASAAAAAPDVPGVSRGLGARGAKKEAPRAGARGALQFSGNFVKFPDRIQRNGARGVGQLPCQP